MKKVIIILLLALAGCNSKPEPKPEYRYTIFVGSVNLAYGYETNSYKDSLGYITFCRSDSVIVSYRKEMLVSIQDNQKAKK